MLHFSDITSKICAVAMLVVVDLQTLFMCNLVACYDISVQNFTGVVIIVFNDSCCTKS
jgi:hypothetical protein